jgi:glycosyltransferase involved in cell wall biosynthesis
VDLLGRFGEAVHLINQGIVVSDRIFRPIGGAKVEFDAICNSSLWPLKRQELAAEIPTVAYVTYYHPGLGTKTEVQPRLDVLRYPPRGHQLLNPISDDLPVRLPPAAVNEAYSRAAVGLCLSPHEGATLASLEYLLAGLPVVSTPAQGGRDTFYRSEYCIIADANPRSVREAVDELRRRAIPRDYVRTRTLELVDAQRRELLALFDAILVENRAKTRFGKTWPFYDNQRLGVWRSLPAIARELDALID